MLLILCISKDWTSLHCHTMTEPLRKSLHISLSLSDSAHAVETCCIQKLMKCEMLQRLYLLPVTGPDGASLAEKLLCDLMAQQRYERLLVKYLDEAKKPELRSGQKSSFTSAHWNGNFVAMHSGGDIVPRSVRCT